MTYNVFSGTLNLTQCLSFVLTYIRGQSESNNAGCCNKTCLSVCMYGVKHCVIFVL